MPERRGMLVKNVTDAPLDIRMLSRKLTFEPGEELLVTAAEVRATARAYGTEPEVFPGLGHNMMLEPGWRAVAERIHSWLGERGY